MSSIDEPITVLTKEEAWDFLRERTMGRLAVSVAGHPDIFPINYYADENSFVFRTAPGSKLLEVTINASVAFEVDSYSTTEAWSVVVKGEAAILEKQADIYAAEALPLRSWVPTLKPVFVRVTPSEINGRHFDLGPEPEPDFV
ncbi:pyridoxamine 5'-phosphate oxidase family protein [Mycetocola miduiensis]|uniref:Nitroimidazol reductase NimA, pyridoxamine 5'-phosphate oxidase superfamily n=1 Tax=Mycetocola miduiensis TaxID=995034 RepID=A0A1I5CVW0_9MICO|nr:pyridoxamine 5'-phosphate oxidase family protein [Mycetocola miduiensis]SFN91140.1 Nitroimidazol reductase NimA, pyridoxamine 5'-phosphate oxidase superfamily [Mycetocola miduiensis]